MAKPVNLDGVRKARDQAKRVGRGTATPEPPLEGHLPDDCPVKPLGKDGAVRFYLDADGQMIGLLVKEHSKLGIMGLFGNQSSLVHRYWPRYSKKGDQNGWHADEAAEMLMAACSRAGVWDAAEKQRGRGAWIGENGSLVLHTGDHVMTFPASSAPWAGMTSVPAGLAHGYVYSRGSSCGAPSPQAAQGGRDGPAGVLLDLLRTWQWRRPEIDPVLLLGWLGAAMIGGALDWRPMVWLTGGSGTGKSTLQKLIKQIFGEGILQSADSTEASLRQTLRHQTLPVALDEIEAEADNRKVIGVIKLARVASSGGLVLRGTSDHRSVEFVVRSAFIFSSILHPPLTPQDRSRITVLDLDELPPGAAPPELEEREIAQLGAQLRRRLVDGWGRFPATIDKYRDALQQAGHNARSADQNGVLMACADLLIFDDAVDNDGLVQWVPLLSGANAGDAEDNPRDQESCLRHLLSTSVDPHRNGGRRTVAEWIRLAAGIDVGDDTEAQRLLGGMGIKIWREAMHEAPARTWVIVANTHQGTAVLYEGTHWAGLPNTHGVWVQALRRLPGAVSTPRTVWFGGVSGRGTMLPLDLVVPAGSVEAPRLPV